MKHWEKIAIITWLLINGGGFLGISILLGLLTGWLGFIAPSYILWCLLIAPYPLNLFTILVLGAWLFISFGACLYGAAKWEATRKIAELGED